MTETLNNDNSSFFINMSIDDYNKMIEFVNRKKEAQRRANSKYYYTHEEVRQDRIRRSREYTLKHRNDEEYKLKQRAYSKKYYQQRKNKHLLIPDVLSLPIESSGEGTKNIIST